MTLVVSGAVAMFAAVDVVVSRDNASTCTEQWDLEEDGDIDIIREGGNHGLIMVN